MEFEIGVDGMEDVSRKTEENSEIAWIVLKCTTSNLRYTVRLNMAGAIIAPPSPN